MGAKRARCLLAPVLEKAEGDHSWDCQRRQQHLALLELVAVQCHIKRGLAAGWGGWGSSGLLLVCCCRRLITAMGRKKKSLPT